MKFEKLYQSVISMLVQKLFISIGIIGGILLVYIHPLQGQPTYIENDQIVAIEAEFPTDYRGYWELVAGRNARTYEILGWGRFQDSLIRIQNGSSVIPTGMSGTVPIAMERIYMNVGRPSEEAIIFASLNKDESIATIFGYEKGGHMNELKAPDRRLAIFPGHSSLSSNGWRIFANAVQWASGKEKKGQSLTYILHDQSNPYDLITIEKLKVLGFEVKTAVDTSMGDELLADTDLLLVSAFTQRKGLGAYLRNVKIPVVVCNPDLFEDMGMTLAQTGGEEAAGELGSAMYIHKASEGDYLRYSFYIKSKGDFKIHLLGKSAGYEVDQYYWALIDPDIPIQKEKGVKIKVGAYMDWNTHLPSISIDYPGWHDLYIFPEDKPSIKSRYPNSRIDKLVISTNDYVQLNEGPSSITVNNGQVPLPPSMRWTQNDQIDREKVWKLKKEGTIIEAEELNMGAQWKVKNDQEGFTGRGYVVFQGRERLFNLEGYNDSLSFPYRLGPLQSRLWIPVWVEADTEYLLNIRTKGPVRNSSVLLVGITPPNARGTAMDIKSNFTERCIPSSDTAFSWSGEKEISLALREGINFLFLSATSSEVAIDRIALYPIGGPDQEKMLNLDLPSDTPSMYGRLDQ